MIMAVQTEGKNLLIRWHDSGLTIIRLGTMNSLELTIDEAIEFAQMWTIGDAALQAGHRFAPLFPMPPVLTNDDEDA